jgi:hemolysin III
VSITRRDDHNWKLFMKRTVAAQTHFVTLVLAILGLLYLLPVAGRLGTLHYYGILAFGISAILVFAVSSTYHFLHDGYVMGPRLIGIMEQLDHCAIYLFIAGTYSPFLINAVKSPWKEILMVTVWAMALAGILYTTFKHRLPQWAQSRGVYTALFVFMGWALVVRAGEIWRSLNDYGLACFLIGTMAYTLGAVVYATGRPRFKNSVFGNHELWHVMVTTGATFHYAMILNFYRPL